MEPDDNKGLKLIRPNLAVLSFAVLVVAIVVVGCHRTAVRHLESQHLVDDLEEFCVESQTTQMTASELNTLLINRLVVGPILGSWNLLGRGRVWFAPEGDVSNCDGVFETWTKYIVKDSTIGEGLEQCGDDNTSCTKHVGDQWCTPTQDHCHYPRGLVVLNTSHVIGGGDAASHVINHETGHVLGLSDPTIPGTDDACVNCGIISDEASDFSTCLWRDPFGQIRWVDSIMHSRYYCSQETVNAPPYPVNHPWPNIHDRAKVENIIKEFP